MRIVGTNQSSIDSPDSSQEVNCCDYFAFPGWPMLRADGRSSLATESKAGLAFDVCRVKLAGFSIPLLRSLVPERVAYLKGISNLTGRRAHQEFPWERTT